MTGEKRSMTLPINDGREMADLRKTPTEAGFSTLSEILERIFVVTTRRTSFELECGVS